MPLIKFKVPFFIKKKSKIKLKDQANKKFKNLHIELGVKFRVKQRKLSKKSEFRYVKFEI